VRRKRKKTWIGGKNSEGRRKSRVRRERERRIGDRPRRRIVRKI
jgi:hypothetical protein